MKESDSKNFLYLSIGRITAASLQAVFFIIFALLLDPAIYGELNLIIALAGTISVFSRFGLNHTLQIYRAKNDSRISDQINTLFVITTSIAAIILVALNPLAAILCIAISFFTMNLQNLLGMRLYKQFMIFSILKSAIFIIVPIALYFVLDIPGIVLGMAFSYFLTSMPYFKQLRMKSFFELKNNYKTIVNNFGVDSSSGLSFLIDKLLVAQLFEMHIVGIYQFNLQVFLALAVLPNILLSFLLTEESSGLSYRKLNSLVITASIILAIAVIVLAPMGVSEFFPKYSEGVFSLQILIISIIPESIQAILNAKLMVRESTKVGLSAILKISILLILIAILGPLYGLVGLSLSVLISITLNVLFLLFLLKRTKITQ
jgi:O-antigen/teichoic acid export membrane protein